MRGREDGDDADARPAPRGFRGDYVIGDAARSASHVVVGLSCEEAAAAAATLSHHDYAFVRRAGGGYSYAILASRSEEVMTFVMGLEGTTKTIERRRWGELVRPVSPEEEEDDDDHDDYDGTAASSSADCLAAAQTESQSERGEEDEEGQLRRMRAELYLARGLWLPVSVSFDEDDDDDAVSCVSLPYELTGDGEGAERYAPSEPEILVEC